MRELGSCLIVLSSRLGFIVSCSMCFSRVSHPSKHRNMLTSNIWAVVSNSISTDIRFFLFDQSTTGECCFQILSKHNGSKLPGDHLILAHRHVTHQLCLFLVHLIQTKNDLGRLWIPFSFCMKLQKLLHSGAFHLNMQAGSPGYTSNTWMDWCYTMISRLYLTSQRTVGIRSFGMVGSFEHLAKTLYPKTNVGAPEKWWLWDDPWGRSIFSGRGPWVSGSFNQSRNCCHNLILTKTLKHSGIWYDEDLLQIGWCVFLANKGRLVCLTEACCF